MTGVAQRSEPEIGGVGELKVHYQIFGGLHLIDAVTRNKAEAELLALLRELSSTIGVPFHVETKARGEGGVVEYWNFVFQHKEHIVFVMAVLGPLLSAVPFYRAKLRQSKQQTLMNELTIQKLKLELAEKEDAAAERAEKKAKAEVNDALPLEPPVAPEEIAKVLLAARKKIARRRSNYYELLIEDSRIEAVGFAASHRAGAQEHVVRRGQFRDYVVARADLAPLAYKRVPIEVVAPVLRSEGLKWRGVFDKKTIGFDLEDQAFRSRVASKQVQFQNGTVLICDLDVLQREDETGDTEVAGYVVSEVYEVRNPPLSHESSENTQMALLEPDLTSPVAEHGTQREGKQARNT